ncbi:MAG: hypothetical protein KJ015_39025 [Myxococcales bacterium]|nr:hypothetical protein [Myxococcales bacterium]MCL4756207.1 hypothetical protein [Myxococcales bacterium]
MPVKLRGHPELPALVAGLVLSSAAAGVIALGAPPRGTAPAAQGPSVAPTASNSASSPKLGPLEVGAELAGARIGSIELRPRSVRVELSLDGGPPLVIGFAPIDAGEPPGPIAFADLSVWYEGRGQMPPDFPRLANALVETLRRASAPRSPSAALRHWRGER